VSKSPKEKSKASTPHYMYVDLNKDTQEDDNVLNEKLRNYFKMKFEKKK